VYWSTTGPASSKPLRLISHHYFYSFTPQILTNKHCREASGKENVKFASPAKQCRRAGCSPSLWMGDRWMMTKPPFVVQNRFHVFLRTCIPPFEKHKLHDVAATECMIARQSKQARHQILWLQYQTKHGRQRKNLVPSKMPGEETLQAPRFELSSNSIGGRSRREHHFLTKLNLRMV